MNLIAAFSQLGMGKDTLCDYLAEKLNISCKQNCKNECNKWQRAAFANAVKNIFCDSFGVDRNFIEVWKRNPEPPPGMLMNVRQSLQMIGDGFRKVKPQIWIEIALRDDNKKIISDGRYINEAKAVKEKGGINILIFRDGYLNDDPNKSESELKPLIAFAKSNLQEGPIDLSESKIHPIGLDYFDFFISNSGSKEDLYQKINDNLLPFIKNIKRK